MRRRGLLCAALVACVVPGPAARADTAYFHATTTGSPVPTVAGEWTHDGPAPRLDVRGVTVGVTRTTFDAGITFSAVGKRLARCPIAAMSVATVSYVDPAAAVDVRTELRWRRPGGRWTRWMRFGEGGVPRGVRLDGTPSAHATHTPPKSCTGPLEYAWRVHAEVAGEAALARMTFDVVVRPS